MFQFFSSHKGEILRLMGEHLWLVGLSMLLAIAIGVPLGIFLTRRPRWKTIVLGTNNVIQTIPSLALFGLLLPLPWLGATPMSGFKAWMPPSATPPSAWDSPDASFFGRSSFLWLQR